MLMYLEMGNIFANNLLVYLRQCQLEDLDVNPF